MPKKSEPDLVQSTRTVREVAVFCHDLIHQAKESDLRPGRDLMAVAKQKRLKVPSVLEGARITYNPRHSLDARSLRQAVVVQLPPKGATPGELARKIGPYCVHVKKTVGGVTVEADVCVSCSYSFPTSVSCTVTITATISV
jgi:hypothetical protein